MDPMLINRINLVGFKNFYYYILLRKRNIRKMLYSVKRYKQDKIIKEKILEIFRDWNAYAKWANSYKLRREVIKKIYTPANR